MIIWTAVRETLLEKYAYAKHHNGLRNSGLIVLGIFIATIVLLVVGLGA